MAKKTRTARIRVIRSFAGVYKGDEMTVDVTPIVEGWLRGGFVKEVDGGENQTGPGAAQPDADERESEGAAGSEPAGSESGQGFGSGAYGTAEVVDPG